jgi:hypothetical protein
MEVKGFRLNSWLLTVLMVSLTGIVGCRGCQVFQSIDDTDKKKKDKVVDRFDVGPLQTLPSSTNSTELFAKPGHWLDLRQQVRANLDNEGLMVSCSGVEGKAPYRPLSVLGLRTPIEFDRNASLAQGQAKHLNYEMFLPPTVADFDDAFTGVKSAIRVSFFPRTFGATLREEMYPVTLMDNYQNLLVTLSQSADQYQFLAGLSCMTWPSLDRSESERISPFRVLNIAESEAQESLPSRFVTMMPVSHLFWNDCNGAAISESQQQTILDWLHFGGRIIVNGPDAQSLKGSFLEPYLPITSLQSATKPAEDWEAFSKTWSIARYGEREIKPIVLPRNREIPTVTGELTKDASWVEGCENFVAERAVANGRVVMTTFPIGDASMILWPSYGSFVNSALLLRPNREWRENKSVYSGTQLAGDFFFNGKYHGQEMNPILLNHVRVLGRDLGKLASAFAASSPSRNEQGLAGQTVKPSTRNQQPIDDRSSSQFRSDVGQLDNQALVAKAAVEGLQADSGINVPRISTILKLLLGYFIVLVPINWGVFRLLGRVEFAWLAAPVIAVVGAIVVAKTVQLDVGFSRSQNMFNVAEFHSGYPRGHVSSYLSLYTSLSTNYSVRSKDNSGILLPYVSSSSSESIKTDGAKLSYEYSAQAGAGLASYPVRSNSTSFVRGESMHELRGPFSVEWEDLDTGSVRLRNESPFELNGVVVVGKQDAGTLVFSSIDRSEPNSNQVFKLQDSRALEAFQTEPKESEVNSKKELEPTRLDRSEAPPGEVKLHNSQPSIVAKVVQQVVKNHQFQSGELMVMGWNQEDFSDLQIAPRASQMEIKSLVIVRNQRAHPLKSSPDLHLPPKLLVDTPTDPVAPPP